MQLSVWEKESFYAPKDIIIAGSGLVGLWSAYYLKKRHPRLTIAIVDRGIIPTGASTRNAGFACFGSITELMEDAQKMGEDKMLELVEMRYRGLQRIQKVFSKKQLDFDLCGGYELFTEKHGVAKKDLEEKAGWLNERLIKIVNKKKTFRLADKKISEFGFTGVTHLVQNDLEGYLHSGKLCQALLQCVQSMGVTVLNGVEVIGFEHTGDGIKLYTNQYLQLHAAQLLVCTNAFAQQLLPELDIVPARGQVLLTAPVPHLPFTGTFHYDEGFYYFRNLNNRILLGGARNIAFDEETTPELAITEKIQAELENFLSHYILPGQTVQITDRWSGIMGMGSEKMPVVQQIQPQVFCAVRMSGMGVALAPVVGESVAKLMMNVQH
jgi:gamma-glutamylputrescine oxidase